MTAYYNEHHPFAAAWLRNLIAAGHIAPGDVDERSIEDVTPCDLRGYTQCHFFAGIGVWSFALRRAGWSDDQEIWTGSCPCQPFSAAGKGVGFADERHLWPAFHYLIEQRRPRVVMGEQVASKDGLAWLDLVQADMEGTRYAFGAADLCAAGVGAPHIRQRLYWVADTDGCARREGSADVRGRPDRSDAQPWAGSGSSKQPVSLAHHHHHQGLERDASPGQRAEPQRAPAQRDGQACGLGDPGRGVHRPQDEASGGGQSQDDRPPGQPGGSSLSPRGVGYAHGGRSGRDAGAVPGAQGEAGRSMRGVADAVELAGITGGMAHADGRHASAERQQRSGEQRQQPEDGGARRVADDDGAGLSRFAGLRLRRPDLHDADGRRVVNGAWADADWIPCRDDSWRPVEPDTFPLAHGAPARVGRLRGYGNAIVGPQAVEVIRAYRELNR